MHVAAAKLTFALHYATSLKDKRQVAKSAIEKARTKFNVSIAEVSAQDSLKLLTIGVCVVSGEASHAQRSLDSVIRYMEENTQADLAQVEMQ
ncbi:MAG: DUF503 domain-containing protein [Eubacteriaceae bacterium]|nr:DUF503 domain-containing protein [Eubacteriaceae bacterium]